jgi:REP element-mobilizing transposase RayT
MTKQLEFEKVKGWGGKRRGAGRKNRSGLVNHAKRERVDFKKPLHITLRLRKGVASLRTQKSLKNFRNAVGESKKFGLHVIHFSLLSNHIHMIVEARDSASLAAGMKSLCGRLGKFIRKISGGKGAVFAGRFHMHLLKSPSEMKRALEYVLLNRAKHKDEIENIDEFSSGHAFREWSRLLGRRMCGLISEQVRLSDRKTAVELSPPRSWLCTSGWMRAH